MGSVTVTQSIVRAANIWSHGITPWDLGAGRLYQAKASTVLCAIIT